MVKGKKAPITEYNSKKHTHKHQHNLRRKDHERKRIDYGLDKVENIWVDYDKQKQQQSATAGTSCKNKNSNNGIFTKYSSVKMAEEYLNT